MSLPRRISLFLSILLLPAARLPADHEPDNKSAGPLPGHSLHGESFNEGPRQAAVLMKGMAEIRFPITTKSPEARKFFEQGVAQLHGFWFFESERSFRQAAALDPDCAMACWGMAMSNVNNEKRAKEFLKKCVGRKDKADAREKLWIAVLENFYRDDKRDKKQRTLDFISDMEAIVHQHPDDIEAKAFLVWKIWQGRDQAPISSHQAADALLDQIFAADPMHPAHHYRIHLWDNKKPERALKSAALCGQASPGIAHMWHMPGHTYSKVRRFDDAAWQQEASTRVDHAHMIANLVLPDQIHNYAHNEEWLVRTFNELGRAKDAIALSTSLIEIPRHPAWNTLDKAATSANYGRTRLLETMQKWELWQQLAAVTTGPLFDAVPQPSHEAARLRSLGTAQFHLNKPADLAATLAKLEELDRKEQEKKKAEEAKKAAVKKEAPKQETKTAEKPKEEVRKAEASQVAAADVKKDGKPAAPASPPPAGSKPAAADKKNEKREQQGNPIIANALSELRALAALGKGDKEAAKKALDAAKDIPKERLARYWLRLDDKKKAEELAKGLSQDLGGLAAKTEILLACGKEADAKTAFESVRKAAFAMDRDLPAARRLDDTAKKLGIAGEWRSDPPKRTDSGIRPPLASLGPVHWHAPKTRPWSALTPDVKPVSDSEHRGKNRLLLFYLGAKCSHCMDQLNAFAGIAGQFKEAGIPILAISPEPPSMVLKAVEKSRDKAGFPFPLLSDPSLEAFKTFRAYDDFEKMPLHAVIFIDSSDHIRWIDIGYQPFTDAKFVLGECQRLLKLPVKNGTAVAAKPAE